MQRLGLLGGLLALLALSGGAHATSILQGGPWTPGHAPMYSSGGTAQPVVQDSGPAGGGAVGYGLGEMLLVEPGTGTPPFVGAGTGPLGTNDCNYDAPITNATGYHYLCFSPNATGGAGTIDFGFGGTASPIGLNLVINGVTYALPAAAGAVPKPIFGGSAATASTSNSTQFVGIASIGATENAFLVAPFAGTIKNFQVTAPTAAGAGQSYTFTVRVAKASTTITCAISGASATTCSDATHTSAVTIGQTIDVQMVSSASAATSVVSWGLEFD